MLGILLLTRAGAVGAEASDWERQFKQPPATARPWINWFWMDGNITREGITADLEGMQRVGIGGVLIMDVTQNIPPGPVRFGTADWFAMLDHALAEAKRLGLAVNLHNAPGWCGSGGPWVTPDLAMQRVVWVGTNLVGPMMFEGPLPPLPKVREFNGDIAVLAFPTLAGDGAVPPDFKPRIVASSDAAFDGAKLLDRDPKTFVTLPAPTRRQPVSLQLEFNQPFTASRIELKGTDKPQVFEAALEASEDGKNFRLLREFTFSRRGVSLGFEAVSARLFRLSFKRVEPPATAIELSELELTPVFRLEAYAAKSGLGPPPKPQMSSVSVPAGSTIPLASILDLSTNLDAAGNLRWAVPPGMWTVLRMGHVPTGRENTPPQPEGRGLECDKLSSAAVEAHFANFIGKLAGPAGRERPGALSFTHIDSWEVGFQNWTPRFREEFARRRGYDPLRYLPAFSGRVVESVERSDRFLWDVRRTIADLVTENYAATMTRLSHRHGLKLSMEGYSSLGGGPFDSLDYGGQVDLPMGEFWNESDASVHFHPCRVMASAAHTHGRPIVAAEAFSAWPNESAWREHPGALKRLADAAFCEGVNLLVLQSHALQPWLNRRPGMTFGHWGLHYDRNQTWWEYSQPWHEYLARCQWLLQRGRAVTDVGYLTAEGGFAELPTRDRLVPAMPAGRDYDLISPAVVLESMSVQNERLTLPNGTNYRVLVLPPGETMTRRLLQKIGELVRAGATVVGARPRHSPSLTDYPKGDDQLRQLTDELWGDCDGGRVKEHGVGRGRIVAGRSLDEILAASGSPPDFQPVGNVIGEPLRYVHRVAAEGDIYFIANPNSHAVAVEGQFRVTGRQPEFWDAETGRIERAMIWTEQGNVTRVPVRLEPVASVFVVFRPPGATTDRGLTISRNGKTLATPPITLSEAGQPSWQVSEAGIYEFRTASGRVLRAEVGTIPKPVAISGPWELRFPPGGGAPERLTLDQLKSWSVHREAGVRFFSGTATYVKVFQMPPDQFAAQRHWFLDLGGVEVMAVVKLNDRNLGILWKPPFRIEVTDDLKPGNNLLEVQVVNRWPNRLIGDEQLPADRRWGMVGSEQPLAEWPSWLLENKPSPASRLTFTTWKHWHKDSPLLPSGLLGPVQLLAEEKITPK